VGRTEVWVGCVSRPAKLTAFDHVILLREVINKRKTQFWELVSLLLKKNGRWDVAIQFFK
jgi:hypothetical protein